MKRLLLIFGILSASLAFGQGAAIPGVTATVGAGNLLRAAPAAPVVVCGYPATGGTPCTNTVTTYTSPTLGTSCPTATPVIIPATTNCSAVSDAQGNFVIFVPQNGSYTYYFEFNNNWFGPYVMTSGNSQGGLLTGVTAGSGLSGGGAVGNVTLNLNIACQTPLNCGTSGPWGFITTPLTGQTLFATNGTQPSFGSPSILYGNGGNTLTTSPYTIACDNATNTGDRGKLIKLKAGAAAVTVPVSGGLCTGTYQRFMDDGAGAVVFSRTSGDVFTVCNGSTCVDSQTSFTLQNGQFANLYQTTAGVWDVVTSATMSFVTTTGFASPGNNAGNGILSSASTLDAKAFTGADACVRAKTAIETVVNGTSAMVVDSRGEVATSIPCPLPPFTTGDYAPWLPAAGNWQISHPIILGGRMEVTGVGIAYQGTNQGTDFQAQTSTWAAGLGACVLSAGSCGNLAFNSIPAWDVAVTYVRGAAVVRTAVNYYAVAGGIAHDPNGGANPGFWSLLAGVPSPVAKVVDSANGVDTEAASISNMSLDCQYVSGTNTATNGCVGYWDTWGQENIIAGYGQIRNATVAGMIFDAPQTADSGPFTNLVIKFDGPGANANHAACKVNGSDASVDTAAITSIIVTNSIYSTVTLAGAPTSGPWVMGTLDVVAGPAAWSNIPATISDETANAHGFFQVYSVTTAGTVFLIPTPAGYTVAQNCTAGCGGANAHFFPTGFIYNTFGSVTGTTVTGTRGASGFTINGSNCTTNPLKSAFPPIGAQFSGGGFPFSSSHIEGFRVGVCVGCFNQSAGFSLKNTGTQVNMYTGILLDNLYGEPTGADIQDHLCAGATASQETYCLVDMGNHLVLTEANNPYILHYWTDAAGVAWLEGGNCADFTNTALGGANGYCLANGVWQQYVNGVAVGYLASAMAAQSSATCTSITNMTWPLLANKQYTLSCEIPVTFAASSTLQFCFAGPGTATSFSLEADGPIGAAAVYAQTSTLAQTVWATKTNASGAPAATEWVHVKANIQNGATASGTNLQLQTAADGTHNITVLANSSCQLKQVN